MATENIKVGLGTEVKINVNMTPLDGATLESISQWSITIQGNAKSQTINKADAIKVDSNNYIVIVDTNQTGAGALKSRVTLLVPDSDLGEGETRTEVTPPIEVGIEVV